VHECVHVLFLPMARAHSGSSCKRDWRFLARSQLSGVEGRWRRSWTMGVQYRDCERESRLEPTSLERPSTRSSRFCSAAQAISTSYRLQQ